MSLEYLTIKQVATQLGVEEKIIKNLCRRGKLAYFRIAPKIIVFTEDDIKKYIDKNRREALWSTNDQTQKDGGSELRIHRRVNVSRGMEEQQNILPKWQNVN